MSVTEDDIIRIIREFSAKEELFRNETVLVALSGGGDSVALLDVLLRIRDEFGLSIAASHVNHALRGEASEADETFCRDLCRERSVHLDVHRLKPGALDVAGDSLETAARNRRLICLEASAREAGATKIATGHTASDLVETVLQRILRGTGPSGLSGILPVRENRWVRPLLCVDRDMLREYLILRRIPFREDETNADTTHFRNRIRHRLLPLIREEFAAGIDITIRRLAELTRVQESWIDVEVERRYRECLVHADDYKILLEKSTFVRYYIAVRQRLIRHCLNRLEGRGRDDDKGEIESIISVVSEDRGIVPVNSSLTVEVYGNTIIFTRSRKRYDPFVLNVKGKTSLPYAGGDIQAEAVIGSRHPGDLLAADIPAVVIERYGTLTVGSVRNGETISLRRNHKPVKIRDLFTTAGIPRTLRDGIPVVRAGAVPLWIPGVARSNLLAGADSPGAPSPGDISLSYHGGIYRQVF